ncbi:MAG: glycine zipper 2TM domain-containing protein [Silvanigrellaceae bacterium]|nr:glycine zipper 2TM domain-containing protein [Silvanigrellaceae bacterium]
MKKSLITIIALSTLVTGCMSNLGGDVYSREDARRVQQVQFGTIVALRPIKIEGTKTPIGTLTGAAIGGIAGSTLGGGKGAYVSAIIGAVGGGLIGGISEELITRSNGVEITFNQDNGETKAIVQQVQENEIFRIGDRIRIMNLNGKYRATRINYINQM